MTRIRSGRQFLMVASAAAALTVATGYLPVPTAAAETATSADGGDMTLVDVHDWAAAQPTAVGKQIVDLEVNDGKIWAGYGDYESNTGPITMAAYDPVTGNGFEGAFTVDSEAIYNVRSINGHVVAPATDPRSADFAVGDPWRQSRPFGAAHVFDAVSLDGTDIWMVGSKGSDAVAWRSVDGGATWAEELRIAPSGSEPGEYLRFYFAAVVGQKLWVQASSSTTGIAPTSKVFDGATWADGPSLLPQGGLGWKPIPFGHGVVYHGQGHGYFGGLYAFDGTSVRELGYGYDIAVSGSRAYMLLEEGQIMSSSDLITWELVAHGPASARSLAVDKGQLYVGTATSELWTLRLGDGEGGAGVDGVGVTTPTGETASVESPAAVSAEQPSVEGSSDDGRGRSSHEPSRCPTGRSKKGRC